MGTNCAPRVADLFLFYYEKDFMMYHSDDEQPDVIGAFNTTSRYLDDISNIKNVYFDNMVSQIYPSELQLNKANTEAAFWTCICKFLMILFLPIFIINVSIFDFEIINFPFLDGDVSRSTSPLNSLVLLEHLAMLFTSTPAINC